MRSSGWGPVGKASGAHGHQATSKVIVVAQGPRGNKFTIPRSAFVDCGIYSFRMDDRFLIRDSMIHKEFSL